MGSRPLDEAPFRGGFHVDANAVYQAFGIQFQAAGASGNYIQNSDWRKYTVEKARTEIETERVGNGDRGSDMDLGERTGGHAASSQASRPLLVPSLEISSRFRRHAWDGEQRPSPRPRCFHFAKRGLRRHPRKEIAAEFHQAL